MYIVLPIFFFLKSTFHIWEHYDSIHILVVCSKSLKNVIRIFMGTSLNLYNTADKMIILTMLILAIYVHWIFSHFLVSFLFFLILSHTRQCSGLFPDSAQGLLLAAPGLQCVYMVLKSNLGHLMQGKCSVFYTISPVPWCPFLFFSIVT